MKTTLPTFHYEQSFQQLNISKLQEDLSAIQSKIGMHSSYTNIRHLIDKEKELKERLQALRQPHV